MGIRRNRETILPVIVLFFSLLSKLHLHPNSSLAVSNGIQVGVILDMGSWIGKTVHSCITMAISDFYAINSGYKTRIVLHTRDSKGDPLHALSAAIDLLDNKKVHAIIGPETFLETTFLAIFGNKAKVPIFSFAASPSLTEHPYFVQIAQDEATQFKAVASVVESFKWRDVIFIYEDVDYGRDVLPVMVESFVEKNIQITYRSAISPSANDDQILEELHKLMAMQTTIFIVHMSASLTSHFFLCVRRLGMMSEEYAWIMTHKTMNLLHTMDSEVIESLQGVVGLKSYVPASNELRNFTLRWGKEYYSKDPSMEVMELSVFGILAYDAIWAIANAVEKIGVQIPQARELSPILNFTEFEVSQSGNILINEISQIRFKGLSGEYQLINGKLISRAFEIVNVIGKGERRVGFWTLTNGIVKEIHPSFNGMHQSSSSSLEAIIWPGGSTTTPKDWLMRMSNKKLRIGLPFSRGFREFVNMERDNQTNETTITGYAIDVFKASIEALPYEVTYEFIPFVDAEGKMAGTYNDLVDQVYLQNYDAVVGDITITANRSLYADFTLPYTDLGSGMIARKIDKKDMWIFLKPLDADLWLTSFAFFILTGFVVWVIENPVNTEFQGSPTQQLGTVFWFTFSTLVFAHRERLSSNLSKFVVIIWVFVVLILTSSYTATLTSLMTVQQIQLASRGDNIGYQGSSLVQAAIVSNLNFTDCRVHQYNSPDEYAEALSRGSKNGGVAAIIDEIPYIKIFLAKYSADYAMVASESITNGFGFAFRKGSPLVSEMSREIAKLRQEGQLKMIEEKWFKSPSLMNEDSVTKPNTLSLDSFRGLFLISGVTSALVLLLSSICFLHKYLQAKNYIFRILAGGLDVMIEYVFPRNANAIQGLEMVANSMNVPVQPMLPDPARLDVLTRRTGV